jgi:ribose transport system substrate-binding protein
MAIGARKAFGEIADLALRERFLGVPFIGCDGVPDGGQTYVLSGVLEATIITPALTGVALELLDRALRSKTQPPQQTLVMPQPFPLLEGLRVPVLGRV